LQVRRANRWAALPPEFSIIRSSNADSRCDRNTDLLKLKTETLIIEGHPIEIELPAEPEAMLEQALQGEATGADGWDPYWGLLWAASPATATLVLKQSWPSEWRCLELGCGVGLTGIAALKAGLHVTFSDQSSAAVAVAQSNAARNGFPHAEGLVFPWHIPPNPQFHLVLASDVLYDRSGHEPMLTTLRAVLAPEGLVWIGDAGRSNAPHFVELARSQGWNVRLKDQNGHATSSLEHLQFRLLELTWAESP
jgi:predicted nicotinamide N-methyase